MLELPQFNFIIDQAATKPYLWYGFLVVAGITVIISIALTYHWQKFDIQKLQHVSFQVVYYVGVVALLGMILILIANF